MYYDKVIVQLNDMLRRAEDNQNMILISDDDKKAIEESKVAVAQLMGYYPENFNFKN